MSDYKFDNVLENRPLTMLKTKSTEMTTVEGMEEKGTQV